jgi:hypothetical protein
MKPKANPKFGGIFLIGSKLATVNLILNPYSQTEHKLKIDRIKEIAKEMGVVYKHANKILNDMIKNDMFIF